MARQTNPKLLADFFNKIGPLADAPLVPANVCFRKKQT
jgi:hypothetical protein